MVVDPMITIKKADGTFAKVPLSEFKKMQGAQKPKEISNIQYPISKPAHQDSQLHTPTHHKPAHHQVVHHAKKSTINNIQYPISNKPHPSKPPDSATASPGKMSRADAGSPLEEKLKTKSSAPFTSSKREKQVEEALGKLGFGVAPDIWGRLKSLVLARLKDIKSEDEVRELASHSIKNGGLGLTEQQVEKIIKSCRELLEKSSGAQSAEAPVLKGKLSSMALMVEPEELPAVAGEVRPMPYNKITVPKPAAPMPKKQEFVSKLVAETAASEPVFKLNAIPAAKQSMRDISAPADMEMGPVEEIKSITLADFRRLSGNPAEAAKRIQQKMFNLQEESFVWYLDALSAYHVSPLYREYMQAVCQSLAERKSLANILAMKNSIKLNEAMALIEMEKTL